MIEALLTVAFLAIAAGVMTWISGSRPRAAENTYRADADFLDQFSLQAYRPIVRLADRMDRKFLIQEHGEALAACYRRIQRQLLRDYLRQIGKDYNRLFAIANARAARAKDDHGELSTALFEQQMNFIFLMWSIEARLFFEPLMPGPINLRPLIEYVQVMAAQTRELGRPQFSYHSV